MTLALAFLLLAAGGSMIWSGVTDAEGGPVGLIGSILRGEETPTLKAPGNIIGILKSKPGSGGPGDPGAPAGGGTGAGVGVAAEAARQIGKPYKWGGNGPNSFDCSGLAIWSLNRGGGLHIGDTTAEGLRHKGKPTSSPQAGDIAFFGIPASHCGVMTGPAGMIAAPSTGDHVRQQGMTGHARPTTYRRYL